MAARMLHEAPIFFLVPFRNRTKGRVRVGLNSHENLPRQAANGFLRYRCLLEYLLRGRLAFPGAVAAMRLEQARDASGSFETSPYWRASHVTYSLGNRESHRSILEKEPSKRPDH